MHARALDVVSLVSKADNLHENNKYGKVFVFFCQLHQAKISCQILLISAAHTAYLPTTYSHGMKAISHKRAAGIMTRVA